MNLTVLSNQASNVSPTSTHNRSDLRSGAFSPNSQSPLRENSSKQLFSPLTTSNFFFTPKRADPTTGQVSFYNDNSSLPEETSFISPKKIVKSREISPRQLNTSYFQKHMLQRERNEKELSNCASRYSLPERQTSSKRPRNRSYQEIPSIEWKGRKRDDEYIRKCGKACYC